MERILFPDVAKSISPCHLQGDGPARWVLDEDLHAAARVQHQAKPGPVLDVEIPHGAGDQLLGPKEEVLVVGHEPWNIQQTMSGFGHFQ